MSCNLKSSIYLCNHNNYPKHFRYTTYSPRGLWAAAYNSARKTAVPSSSISDWVLVLFPARGNLSFGSLASDTRSLSLHFPFCLGHPARSSLPLVGNTWLVLLILLRAGMHLGSKILPRKYHPSCLGLIPTLSARLCCSRQAVCTITIGRYTFMASGAIPATCPLWGAFSWGDEDYSVSKCPYHTSLPYCAIAEIEISFLNLSRANKLKYYTPLRDIVTIKCLRLMLYILASVPAPCRNRSGLSRPHPYSRLGLARAGSSCRSRSRSLP